MIKVDFFDKIHDCCCINEGPFQVTEMIGPVTYRIRRSPRCKPWTVHADKLKSYHTEISDDLPAPERF